MALWNSLVGVVANVEAASNAEAIAILRRALMRAGFDLYLEGDEAFEAEEGTEATELP